jgi:hypothetical protein
MSFRTVRIALQILACLMVVATATAAKPAGGFRGVPWTGSRDDFKRAIPELTCYPIACSASFAVGDIATKLDIVWGGFASHVTSITIKFSKNRVSDMAKVLRTKYGAPSNQHHEDGELVSEWKLPDVLIDLYHGQRMESDALVYFEPTAQAKIQSEELRKWRENKAKEAKPPHGRRCVCLVSRKNERRIWNEERDTPFARRNGRGGDSALRGQRNSADHGAASPAYRSRRLCDHAVDEWQGGRW